MKKFLTMALAGIVLLGGSVTFANVCAFDPAPAVTLLFPFVVFDYNNMDQGANTLFAITNVSDEAQIVHITIWSDLSEPVLDFNVVLSGYDVQTINLRDILKDGQLPITATQTVSATDPGYSVDGDVPQDDGPVSNDNANWVDNILPDAEGTVALNANCPQTANPGRYTQKLDNEDLATLEYYFTLSQNVGRVQLDHCGTGTATYTPEIKTWWDLRDATEPTWMYITADIVTTCNRDFPDTAPYWDAAMVRYENVLIGDVFYLNDLANFSEAQNAVHLEADVDLASVATMTPLGPISFYHRYTSPPTLTPDFREPLPTAWAIRYIGAEVSAMDTHIRVFKASTNFPTIQDLTIHTDGTLRAHDCEAYTYFAWDEDEGVTTTTNDPWSDPEDPANLWNILPLETQEVEVDDFRTPGANGWMLFVWPNSNYDGLTATLPPDYYQTWMGVRYSAFGKFSAAKDGNVMANWNCFDTQVLPGLGVEFDYVTTPGGFVN